MKRTLKRINPMVVLMATDILLFLAYHRTAAPGLRKYP